MLGRVLFALVWVVIAAGLALPLYPFGVEGKRSAAVDPVLVAANSMTAACEGSPIADDGRAACQPDLLLATLVRVGDRWNLSVILVIRPTSQRQALPPKLPAI